MIRSSDRLRGILALGKLKIMIPVTLTGFTGYFIFDPRITKELLLVTAGIFLMAVAASVLNQIQEVDTDRKMLRTQNRPLPAGTIPVALAFLIFIASFLAGAYLIFLTGSTPALVTSIFTVLWYNGVYTYLKRITAYAVIPGSLTGALPPLIGWLAAGGPIVDKVILTLQSVLFIGQIPHFWLFILRYGGEYEAAGLPSLTTSFPRQRITRMIFVMIIAAGAMILSFYPSGLIVDPMIFAILIVLSALLVNYFRRFSGTDGTKEDVLKCSLTLNIYFLLLLLLIITDRII